METSFSSQLIQRLKSAQWVTVLTGAGISAESGIPTFRDPGGHWQNYRPEQLASQEAFQSNPDLVWQWYMERRRAIQKAKPNPGHVALAKMTKFFPQLHIITQNVDGLHSLAGTTDMTELHGNIFISRCSSCSFESQKQAYFKTTKCPTCQNWLRPGVVWFGESLSDQACEQALFNSEKCDVFLSIGTSGLVFPAAGFVMVAQNQGAYTVEINKAQTDVTSTFDEFLKGSASSVLTEILKELETSPS